jgi:two-component system sensor histidine kinase DesK
VAETPSVVQAGSRSWSWFWHLGRRAAYLFLIGLVAPASDILAGRAHPAWLAGLALGAFIACFVAIVESAPDWAGIDARQTTPARRRAHLALVVLLGAIALASSIAFGGQAWTEVIFVVVTLAMSVPLRATPAAIVLVAVLSAGAAVARGGSDTMSAFMMAVTILMAGFVALLLRRGRLLITELRAAQGEVARLAAADAVSEERLRFARDLHDLLGHSLSVIALKTELARRLIDRDAATAQVRAEISDAEQITRRALEEVRQAVSGYRAQSVTDELQQAEAALRAAGIEARFRVHASRLPSDLEQLFAWVVREAATNIVRHSRAVHAEFELSEDDDALRLEVRDDGIGLATKTLEEGATGSGLRGLRERLLTAGGSLTTGTRPEGGCRLLAVVPLHAGAQKAGEPMTQAREW